MDWETKRLLELAGLKRRRTPDHLLQEGDDEGGGDDLFGDDTGDDAGGDDFGGDDDPFASGDDEGGDDSGDEGGEESDIGNRIPPQDLSARDVERFGSPRFKEIESKLQGFFNQSMTSASVAAQELEVYPGVAIVPEDEDETPAMDADEKEKKKEEAEDGEEEKNESFYRYGNKRDKWLIAEANRLLLESEEDEGASSDEFDSEHFANLIADYMENIHNTMDIEGGIFNMARQMLLNNFGPAAEEDFCQNLAAIDPKWDFKGSYSEIEPTAPIAVGGSPAAAGA